jgi:hypothetical protein
MHRKKKKNQNCELFFIPFHTITTTHQKLENALYIFMCEIIGALAKYS